MGCWASGEKREQLDLGFRGLNKRQPDFEVYLRYPLAELCKELKAIMLVSTSASQISPASDALNLHIYSKSWDHHCTNSESSGLECEAASLSSNPKP